jgi:hypothetical protein
VAVRVEGVTVSRAGFKRDRGFDLGIGEDAIPREYFARCDPGGCER